MTGTGSPPNDWWERIATMEKNQAACSAAVGQRLGFLEQWKRDQNGQLKDLRDGFAAFRGSFNKWLVGLLTSILIAVMLLVMNLFVHRAEESTEVMEAITQLQTAVETTIQQTVDEAVQEALHEQNRN